jgi:hypothetical protein
MGWMDTGVDGTGAVGAQILIPAIAVARDPSVHKASHKVNAGDKKQPGNEIPSRQGETNARPGIGAGENSAACVNGLHQAHGFFPVNLRETRCSFGIV